MSCNCTKRNPFTLSSGIYDALHSGTVYDQGDFTPCKTVPCLIPPCPCVNGTFLEEYNKADPLNVQGTFNQQFDPFAKQTSVLDNYTATDPLNLNAVATNTDAPCGYIGCGDAKYLGKPVVPANPLTPFIVVGAAALVGWLAFRK